MKNLSRSTPVKRYLFAALGLLAAGLIPCRAETIVALYSNNRLRYFDSASPETSTHSVLLSGIPAAETVVALDYRSPDRLFVATREGARIRFYEIDTNSGAATGSPADFVNLETGTGFGMDFLPPLTKTGFGSLVLVSDADRLQIGDTTQPGTNARTVAYDNTTSDGDPVDQHAGDNPAITALAFSNNFPEATSTVLYGIDATPNSLVVVDRFTGQLDTVGPLGAATGTRCGFDISGTTGTAYAALSSGDSASLYTIDLGTGAAKAVGTIGGQIQQVGVTLVDISVVPVTRLLNISTRTRVGTGEDVTIAGFTTVGGATSRLLIRGLGPSLAAFGIAAPLPDPYLTVFDANGAIGGNDNWRSDQGAEISSSRLPPTNELEAAYIGIFAPGAYTAILRDANNATGVGVIEVYKLTD